MSDLEIESTEEIIIEELPPLGIDVGESTDIGEHIS